jgi:predicted signal transduction protein with EAL and GGDEF domain
MVNQKLSKTLADIYRNIILLTGLLSFILYCALQYFVIRRIRALALATASVSAQNWTTKVPQEGADEISFLGRSINSMLVKINDLIEGLNVNIGQLEKVNLEAKKDQQKMEQLAYYDHLSGLHNRILFKDHLRTTLHICQRDKSHFALLSHLKRLPVNTLKIDRSFVEGLPDDDEDRVITTLIVAMANSLNYKVVVEGVETAAQLTFLTLCGCDYAQGYYFSKPVPADQLMQLLFDEDVV